MIIHLGKPTHSGDWFPSVRDFILEYRRELIADIVGYLRRSAATLQRHSRWGEWEHGVLARLPHAQEAQRLILQRRGESDIEAATAVDIEAFIAQRLAANGYDPTRQRVRIPSEVVTEWLNAATGQDESIARASSLLRQMGEEGQLQRLQKSLSHKHARAFVWTGEEAQGSSTIQFERRSKTPRKA